MIKQNFATMIHRGEIVEKVVRESAYPITKLAKRLGKSRKYVYNLFENDLVNWDVIIDIGKILHHDFSEQFRELSTYEDERNIVEDRQAVYLSKYKTELDEYKEELRQLNAKYIELLEKYNALLNQELKQTKKK